MLWITDHTPEYTAARMDAINRHVRCTTRCMTLIAVGAATVQMLLDMTYIFCL